MRLQVLQYQTSSLCPYYYPTVPGIQHLKDAAEITALFKVGIGFIIIHGLNKAYCTLVICATMSADNDAKY